MRRRRCGGRSGSTGDSCRVCKAMALLQCPPLKDNVKRYTQSLLRDALSQAFVLERRRLEVVELVRRQDKHQLRSLERKGVRALYRRTIDFCECVLIHVMPQ